MRAARPRLPALLVVALLAGCQVDVEGAPCSAPGTTIDCPGGQACGNELRCSVRAAACLATRCTPGVGDACLDPSGVGSGTALARRCTAADAACGAWIVDSCAGQGLVCGARAGGAACECPEGGWELVVRPDGGPAGDPPYATGAATPPVCAFRTIADAMARAGALRELDPAHAVTVTLAGAPAGGTATFPTVSPLFVNRGVTLRSDPASGGTSEILTGSSASSVVLRDGATLRGVTVRSSSTDGLNGVDVYGSGSGRPVRVSAVTVVGPGAAAGQGGSGLWIGGDAVVLADDLHVRDFAGPGLFVDAALSATTPVSISGGSITACGAGALVHSGRFVLDGVRVSGNAGRGVDVEPLEASTVAVEVRSSRIVGNGDTGIALVGVSELRVSHTTVFGNGATTAWGGAAVASGTTRRGGGVVLSGVPPPAEALELRGNRIYGNGGDQVLALGPATATWVLDQPATCLDAQGPVTNMIGCYDPSPAGTTGASRGIVAIDAAASALNQWWEGGVAPSSLDVARLPAGTIPATTACVWTTPALSCGSEEPPP